MRAMIMMEAMIEEADIGTYLLVGGGGGEGTILAIMARTMSVSIIMMAHVRPVTKPVAMPEASGSVWRALLKPPALE